MSFISQKIKQKPTYREILFQKVKAVRELQIENQTHLTYVQAQFIVNQKTIKQSLIFLIFKQKYQDQFDNVQNFWKNTIDDQKFIDDLFYLKKKVVGEQWIGQRMKEQKLQQKEQKIKEFISKTKNKFQVKNRLKTLKDELSIAENKINMAKNEDESVKLVKEYVQLKNQENFLKNRNRRMLTLEQQRNAQSMSKSNITVITKFEEKLDQKVNQNIRNKYIKEISQAQTKSNHCKTEDDEKYHQIINPESKVKIQKLEKVFNFYAKKEGKDSMLFGEMLAAQKYVSLQNYLKMISEIDLDSLLTSQQKVHIFKKNSNYDKRINFTQFINSVIQIAKTSSERLSVKLDSAFFDNFIENFLNKAKQNFRYQKYNSVSIHQKTNTNYLRNKQTPKYQFKILPHSGKFASNISEELIDRKRIKQQKYRKLKEFNFDRKQSINTTINPIVEQQKKKQIENKFSLKLIDIQRQQKSIIQPQARKIRKNTYLSLYKNRVELQNNKSLLLGKKKLQSNFIETEEIPEQNSIYVHQNVFKKEVEDLKDLIQMQEEDTFLTSHLQRKSNFLNSLKAKRLQKVHF